MTTLTEDKALAIVFANTKRKKRTEDLVTIAEAFEYLVKLYGSQAAVSKKTGLSQEIVREFRKVLSLPDEVLNVIRARKVDSLDAAYRIAMLDNRDQQIRAAKELADLQSGDIRDIRRLMSDTGLSVEESKKKVLEAKLKGLHIFVIDFDNDEYKVIVKKAKSEGVAPAQLVKRAVLEWLEADTHKAKRRK